MLKADRDNTSKRTFKWIVLGLVIVLLGVGGYFGYKYYQDYQANKVYSVNEAVGFPNFEIKVTKAEFKPVDLPIDEKAVEKYGAINKKEDCDKESKNSTWWNQVGDWNQYGPSDFNICIRRNNSRDEINKYSSENQQLVVDYKIVATNNVNTSDLKIELITDSGRELGKQVNTFNANQFFPNGAQEKDVLDWSIAGAPGPVYTDEWPQEYKPYHKSDIGGDINKGLERTGYLYTDIRNSENSVDLKVTYNSQTRLVRINK